MFHFLIPVNSSLFKLDIDPLENCHLNVKKMSLLKAPFFSLKIANWQLKKAFLKFLIP